jgi:outer membrane protein insertion porin family
MAHGARARVVRRAQVAALSLGLLALACSRPEPRLAAKRDERELARRRACSAPALPPAAEQAELPLPDPPLERIAGVEVLGVVRVPPELVKSTIGSKPGQRLDPERLADDVHKLWQLEVFDDVRVGWRRKRGGLWLSLSVRERPLIGELFSQGPAEQLEELGLGSGSLYEPARLHRRARDLERSLISAGFRQARVSLRGAPRAGRIDLCAVVEPGPRVTIERLEFVGNQRLTAAELRAQMQTEGGTINTPGRTYRAEVVERDLLLLHALYYDRGMLEAQVVPRVRETERALQIVFEIDEGPVFRIGTLSFSGQLAVSRQRYRELLGARSGEVFSRQRMLEGMDRISALHHALGRDDLDVEPRTKLHSARGRVDIELELVRR